MEKVQSVGCSRKTGGSSWQSRPSLSSFLACRVVEEAISPSLPLIAPVLCTMKHFIWESLPILREDFQDKQQAARRSGRQGTICSTKTFHELFFWIQSSRKPSIRMQKNLLQTIPFLSSAVLDIIPKL